MLINTLHALVQVIHLALSNILLILHFDDDVFEIFDLPIFIALKAVENAAAYQLVGQKLLTGEQSRIIQFRFLRTQKIGSNLSGPGVQSSLLHGKMIHESFNSLHSAAEGLAELTFEVNDHAVMLFHDSLVGPRHTDLLSIDLLLEFLHRGIEQSLHIIEHGRGPVLIHTRL